jgi:enoyl-CoA hydratase
MSKEALRIDRDGRVMTVRIDNPPRNFMTGRMVNELDELARTLERDPSIGAVVITGATEGLFVTHYDVHELLSGAESAPNLPPGATRGVARAVGMALKVPGAQGALERTPAAGFVRLRQLHEALLRMNRMGKVFIAAIGGPATGSGAELALACDVRIMADGDFVFGFPELSIGIIPGAGGTQRLTRALGASRTLELLLEARTFAPREALDAGLVHRVVPPAELHRAAHAAAERLARRPAAAVEGVKRAVYEGASRSLLAGLRFEEAAFAYAAGTPSAQLAMRAFADELAELDERVPSPWADPAMLRSWQEGTVWDPPTDTGEGGSAGHG